MFIFDGKLGSEGYDPKDWKTKYEMKKELENSIANDKRNENTDIQQTVKNCTANDEDAAKVIEKFGGNKESDIAWLERFANNMVLKFKVSKSIIVYKIALARLIDDYRKIRASSLSLHYF